MQKDIHTKFRLQSYSVWSILLLSGILLLSACGGSSSDAARPTPGDVSSALASRFGSEGGFDAMISAFARGYSLQQVVDAALSGQMGSDGIVQDATGATVDPLETPVGSVVARSVTRKTQILIEANIVEVSLNFMEELGADFSFGGSDLVLLLRESGYSANQVINMQDLQQGIEVQSSPEMVFITSNAGARIDPLLPYGMVLDLSALVNPSPTASPSPSSDSSEDILSLIDFVISPTNIEGTHTIGVSPCPQHFGQVLIENLSSESVEVTMVPNDNGIAVSRSVVVIGGLSSELVNVNFTCKKAVPFFGEIPFIGRLFRNNAVSAESKTLMLFVTPKIVSL